jgi:phosphoribosylanthranilate isomerase
VQIYTAQTPTEATALAGLGVDHVGVTPANLGLPGEVAPAAARAICDALKGEARAVALTVSTVPDEILEMVERVGPDILHLCGPPGVLQPADVARLRDRLGDVEIMQAVAVDGPGAVGVAASFEPVVDYLLLDSVAPGIPGIGAAGTVHDWALSAEIVQQVSVPVILAGGLSASNVDEAIRVVDPWGVDSLTHTNRPLEGERFSKDLEAVRAFVHAAKYTAST